MRTGCWNRAKAPAPSCCCRDAAAARVAAPTVGASAWSDAGAFVGAEAVIGRRATLARSVEIAAGGRVGRRCLVEVPGRYRRDVVVGTRHLATPVVIAGG
jgi:UDP-3-O-[3-hydroxymyristoyl] glucosamine N-acyltransferase